MTEKAAKDFLPLGSVLKLTGTDNDELFYMIVARAVAITETEDIVPRYRVAPHPYGDIPSQEIFSISAREIVEILFRGYADQADDDFLAHLIEQASKGEKLIPSVAQSGAQTAQPTPLAQPKPVMDEAARLKEDPFYKFRKVGLQTETDSNG